MEAENVVVKRAEVVSVLDSLGLAEGDLRGPVQRAYAEAFGCTDHDPRGLPGYIAYGRSVRYLRDVLVDDKGWSPKCESNFELTIDPAGQFAIVVWAGTSETGLGASIPTNRNPKGTASRKAITSNQASFADYKPGFPRFSKGILTGRACWVLLHYHDRETDEVRLELSFPTDFSEGYVRNWGQRIVLSSVPVGPAPFPADEGGEDDADIPVVRRQEA